MRCAILSRTVSKIGLCVFQYTNFSVTTTVCCNYMYCTGQNKMVDTGCLTTVHTRRRCILTAHHSGYISDCPPPENRISAAFWWNCKADYRIYHLSEGWGVVFFFWEGGCHSAMVESRRLSDRWRTLTQLRLTNVLLTINFIFLSVKRVCWGREILDCGGERERRRNLIPLMVNRSKGWYTIQNLSSVRPSSGCS